MCVICVIEIEWYDIVLYVQRIDIGVCNVYNHQFVATRTNNRTEHPISIVLFISWATHKRTTTTDNTLTMVCHTTNLTNRADFC